jgi:hypothetical protein
MTFDSLHADTDCDCLGGTFEDTDRYFARKISRPVMKTSDFFSHWEREKFPAVLNCKNTCMHKGLSFNEWNDETKEKVIAKYANTVAGQNRKGKIIKDCVLIFRLKENMGLINFSPTRFDPSHHTFFKSDTFDVDNLELVEIIALENYVNP